MESLVLCGLLNGRIGTGFLHFRNLVAADAQGIPLLTDEAFAPHTLPSAPTYLFQLGLQRLLLHFQDRSLISHCPSVRCVGCLCKCAELNLDRLLLCLGEVQLLWLWVGLKVGQWSLAKVQQGRSGVRACGTVG